MKRLLKNVLLITLVITSLLLTSCGKLQKHESAGLVFYLPKDMTEMNVTYADKCYGNGEAEFFIYYYSRDELLTYNFIDKDSTSGYYLEDFIAYNGYTDVELTINDENNTAQAKYIYEDEYLYYHDYVVRNYDMLAHVTMSCKGELRDTYEPIFDEWAKNITLEELN